MDAAVPILRMFDEEKTMLHYIGFLGFQLDWEHRFAENAPLYAQISRGACVINLSGHYGDGTPGSVIRVRTEDLDAFCRELQGKDYKYAKPGDPIEQTWGALELTITDPSGNKLVFWRESETVP